MTKTEISERLNQIDASIATHTSEIKRLNEELQRMNANLHILHGNKNECLFWLGKLNEKESEVIESVVVLDAA